MKNKSRTELEVRLEFLRLINDLKSKVKEEVAKEVTVKTAVYDEVFLEFFYDSTNKVQDLLMNKKPKDIMAIDHLEYQLYLLKEESQLDYPLDLVSRLISVADVIEENYH